VCVCVCVCVRARASVAIKLNIQRSNTQRYILNDRWTDAQLL